MSDAYHYNWLDPIIDSEATVLAIRSQAMSLLRQGKTLMEWEGEGTSSKKAWVAPVSEILAETRYCLKQINPGKYGAIVRQTQVLRLG
jgi:hypothetical protein